MPVETMLAGEATNPCNEKAFGFFSSLRFSKIVLQALPVVRPWLAGLFVTFAQLAIAVFLLAPEGDFSTRYNTLVQHDGFWFANILDRGYQTTVPPINHKVMEVSNVAFFPAYPVVASAI